MDVPEELASLLDDWRERQLIVRVQRQNHAPNRYRTARAAARYVETNLDDRATLPCGNAGIRNLRGESGYTCWHEDCDARFDRETAKAVITR